MTYLVRYTRGVQNMPSNETFNMYIGKDYKEWFDQLKVICENHDISLNNGILSAIKYQIESEDDVFQLIANKKRWNQILDSKTRGELLEDEAFISRLHSKILERL